MEKKTIVAFDFDGTITTKSSFAEFIIFTKGYCRFLLGLLIYSPFLVAYVLKLYPNWKAKEKLFSYFYKNTTEEDFNQWSKAFTIKIDAITRPETVKAIKKHLSEDATVIIVSASIDTWIKLWAEEIGVGTVLATQFETDSNKRLTGKFRTKNCYGKEKVQRIKAAFPNRTEYCLIAYGDSIGDKEMIEFADKGWLHHF